MFFFYNEHKVPSVVNVSMKSVDSSKKVNYSESNALLSRMY